MSNLNENIDWDEETEFINLLGHLGSESFPRWLTINNLIESLQLEPLITVSGDLTLYEAIWKLRSEQIGSLVVTNQEGILLGIFTERDLVNRVMLENVDLQRARIKDYMTNSPKTVPGTESIAVALNYFVEGQYRHLPIIRNGKLTHMLSVKDFLKYLASEFKTATAV